MKKHIFLIGIVLVFLSEIFALIIFAVRMPKFSLSSVEVNEAVQSVSRDFYSINLHVNETELDYVVIDNDGKVIFKTKSGLSESLNSAISHRDTIMDIKAENVVVGKIIIFNNEIQSLQAEKKIIVIVLMVAIIVEFIICFCYYFYLHFSVIRPFRKLEKFAERVAGGNLDLPLEMDKQNLFGAWTESFDIMRSELKKARIAEAQANASKKELVAKLSHDIKTPIASIKALSEVGNAVSSSKKDKESFAQIIGKADQINTLVSNLFSATLEELEELTVSPTYVQSIKVKAMLENADYLKKAKISDIPECLVFVDELRLQQVFDNIFINSYKYANTEILVDVQKNKHNIEILIEDFGGGVKDEELLVIKEKFKRGSNADKIEGSGLGLYISDYFMKEMNGTLFVENGTHGLLVRVVIALTDKI